MTSVKKSAPRVIYLSPPDLERIVEEELEFLAAEAEVAEIAEELHDLCPCDPIHVDEPYWDYVWSEWQDNLLAA